MRRGSKNTEITFSGSLRELPGRRNRPGGWRFDSGFLNDDLMGRLGDDSDRHAVGMRMRKPIVAPIIHNDPVI